MGRHGVLRSADGVGVPVNSGYRDAFKMSTEEAGDIHLAAKAMCESLGYNESTDFDQAHVLVLAMVMFHDRNAEVHDAWRRVGWAGNLLTLYGKVVRLMNGLWWSRSEGRSEKPIDNAIDAINYSAFFVRLYQDNDERGSQ